MDVVALLEAQAVATKQTLAPYVIEPVAGIWRVMQYPVNPDLPAIIVKRYTSHQQAEDFLLTLCPRPAATRVQA